VCCTPVTPVLHTVMLMNTFMQNDEQTNTGERTSNDVTEKK
jgi:hypothetical protein